MINLLQICFKVKYIFLKFLLNLPVNGYILTSHGIIVGIIHIISGFFFTFMIFVMVHMLIKTKQLTLKFKRERKLLKTIKYHVNKMFIHTVNLPDIVDSVKGKIEIRGESYNETIVTFIFPKSEMNNFKTNKEVSIEITETGLPFVKLPEVTYEKEKQTVFIIDENAEMISHIYKCMSMYFNVFYAANGIKALDKLNRIPKPDIIISNLVMDKMDGYEFYHNLLQNEKFKDIPVFFLSSLMDQQEKIEALKKGIIDVIYKPLNMEELVEKVRSFLRNRKVYIESQRKRLEKKISLLLRGSGDDEFLNFEKKCILYRISPREKCVLREILLGLQTKEIAAKLFLSTHTVKKHIRTIYKKCNVQNRVELVNCFKP